jgi:hypothetical protein
MAAEGTDWVAVCDEGDRLRGWVWGDDVGTGSTLADVEARPFRAVVRPDTTLKAALDVILSSRTRVAVVVEGPPPGAGGPAAGVDQDATGGRRYLGMLTLDDLAEGVTDTAEGTGR